MRGAAPPIPPRRKSRCGAVAALVALTAVFGACDVPAPPAGDRLVELVDELPTARVWREVRRVDFGSPDARSHLIDGWSWNETGGDGERFVWSDGRASRLRFFLASVRDLPLRFEAHPYRGPGTPVGVTQELELLVNGSSVTAVELAVGVREHRVELPAGALSVGENILEARYRYTAIPAEHGTGADRRRLGARWVWLSLAGEAAAPSASSEELTLPAGSQADFYLEVPAGSHLVWDGVDTRRRGDTRLEVDARTVGGSAVRLATLRPEGVSGSVALPSGPGALSRIRLSLRSVGDGPPAEGEALVLRRGAVVAPPSSRAVVAPPSTPAEGAVEGGRPPDLIVYLIDTLRADRLGVYGGSAGLTPAMDAFAATATTFDNAIAQSSWTKTSVATLFTGLHPRVHGLNDPSHGLPPDVGLLAEHLQRAGYQTAGFVTNAHLSEASGFARGFDHYSFLIDAPNDAEEVNRRVFAWWDRHRDEDRPLFLYVHTIDPHAPYVPPEPFRSSIAGEVSDPDVGSVEALRAIARKERPVTPTTVPDLLALYDAEVAFADREWGRFVAGLEERGAAESAVVALLSDHGEQFLEHGVLGHGWDLYNEVLHVPLIVRWPGRQPERVTATAQHLDLLPTLLTAAGLSIPSGLEGVDLAQLATNRDPRPVVSSMDYEGRAGASLIEGPLHLIEPISADFAAGTELYDRVADPLERDDLGSRRPVEAGFLRSLLVGHLLATEGGADAPEVEIDEESRRRLQALGYLGDG